MKRPSLSHIPGGRFLAGLLVLLVLVGSGGYFLVRQVLSPEKFRPLAEAKLSVALGKPVQLGKMSIHLFPVPALEAEGIFVGAADKAAPSLAIAALRIVPSLSAALRGELVVDRVELQGLDIALRRNQKGEWLLPYDPPKDPVAIQKTEGSADKVVSIRKVRIRDGRFRLVDDASGSAREVAALQDIQGTLAVDSSGVKVNELSARFLKTKLTGSALIASGQTTLQLASPSIASEDVPQILAFLGAAAVEGLSIAGAAPFRIEMAIPQKGSITASGELEAATLRLGTMEVTDLKAPFRVEKDTATLSPLTFTAYKGRQKGSVVLALAKAPMGYAVKTVLEGLDVNLALSANTSAKDVLSGRGRVSGAVKGAGFDSGALTSRLSGNAEVALRDGIIRNLPLLARINQALKITGGDQKDTRFESLEGTFVMAGGKAHTEDLLLKAGELSLAAKGDILFELTLAIKGTARFTPAKTAEILHKLSDLKRLVNDKGELEVPLTVSGPVSTPSVNVDLGAVMEKAVKEELKQRLGDKLKSLFGK